MDVHGGVSWEVKLLFSNRKSKTVKGMGELPPDGEALRDLIDRLVGYEIEDMVIF